MSEGIRLHPRAVHNFGHTLRDVPLEYGLPSLEAMEKELKEYIEILLGRKEAPINEGLATLMEVANAYFSRACELDMLIHEGERKGDILRNSDLYKFRTGELRSFLDMTKRAFDLGSRRITVAQLMMNERMDSGILR